MADFPMKVNLRRLPHNKDLFEFTIATPALRSQFRITRPRLNEIRILIEKALVTK